jgi:hypothetical protein
MILVQIATTQSDFVRFKKTLKPTNQQGCSCFVHVFPCFFHPKFGQTWMICAGIGSEPFLDGLAGLAES